MQNNEYNLRVEANKEEAKAILCQKGVDTVLGTCALGGGEVTVAIRVEGLRAFIIINDETIGEADVRELSTEVAGGFVGCTIGMYASANGTDTDKMVNFKTFSYEI